MCASNEVKGPYPALYIPNVIFLKEYKTMDSFEGKLSWILSDFKNNKINFSQATLKIEQAIVQTLGINTYILTQFSEMVEYITELEAKKHNNSLKTEHAKQPFKNFNKYGDCVICGGTEKTCVCRVSA